MCASSTCSAKPESLSNVSEHVVNGLLCENWKSFSNCLMVKKI